MKKMGFLISHKNGECRRALLPEHMKEIRNLDSLYFEQGYGVAVGVSDDEYLKLGCHVVPREGVFSCDIITDVKLGDAYRSSVFKDLLWDENVKIYTDFSYILPILMTGYKYDYSIDSREDYLYRVNQKNAMTSSFISEEKYKSTLYLFNKTQELILSSPQRNVHKKAFKKYYIIQLERILNTKNNDFFVDFKFFYEKFYGKELRIYRQEPVLRRLEKD